MSKPTTASWAKLIRVVKYLQRSPRLVLKYDYQEPVSEVDVYSDASWAGCKATRRSTSGGIIMRRKHLLKNWSKNQTVIALSSAESEFHATIKAAVEGLGMTSMANSFGNQYKIRMHVDASAALEVIQRKGVGRIRHLHTGCLWIQEQALRNNIAFAKIIGIRKPAGLFTKYLSREAMDGYLEQMRAEKTEGRAAKAAQLHVLRWNVRQLKAQFRNQDSKRKIVDRIDPNTEEVDEVQLQNFIQKKVMDNECAVQGGYAQWLRAQCRQQGCTRKIGTCKAKFTLGFRVLAGMANRC